MKRCYICKEEKELKEFSKDKTTKSGYQSACKKCQRKISHEYRQNNRNYFKIKGKERYEHSLKDDPLFNKHRYEADKESFIKRRNQYRTTEIGRLRDLYSSAMDRARTKKSRF
jgi:hypothetical protein